MLKMLRLPEDLFSSFSLACNFDSKVIFNNNAWKQQALLRLANFLTRTNEGTDGYLSQAAIFALTRATIELETLAFGCAIAFELFIYRNMFRFCEYSYHTSNGTIESHDISVELDYLPAHWYFGAKTKFHNLTNYREFNVTQKLRSARYLLIQIGRLLTCILK
jgi:hypothetical protein